MTAEPPRLLLVGGSGGLVGRAVLEEFLPHYRIRSVHRHPVFREQREPWVEWVRADVADPATDWTTLLHGVDAVMTLAWYRWERPLVFARLADGLLRLLAAARTGPVPRFLHVSVPGGPPKLEASLPYFREKRRFDRALTESGLSYRILRPTMLYAPGDRLLGVMFRMMRRYRLFPMFGDGRYHVSPVAAEDLAHALRLEAGRTGSGSSDVGGPVRFAYRELTDLMFHILGRRPHYLALSAATARRLTAVLVAAGSTVLYPYEVDWLVSDRLGLDAYGGLDRQLREVGPYLTRLAGELHPRRVGAQA